MGHRSDLDNGTVQRAATGDRAAFDALWVEYNPRLLRYLSSLGLHDAEDIASQTWLEVFQRLGSLDDRPGSFRRLLFTIGRRRMIDEIRRRGRHQELPCDRRVADSAEHEALGVRSTLELLALLPPAQAEVIALRVIVGLSAAEVGEMTGQSPGAVRGMGHRGLRALQALVGPTPAESFDPLQMAE